MTSGIARAASVAPATIAVGSVARLKGSSPSNSGSVARLLRTGLFAMGLLFAIGGESRSRRPEGEA